MAALNPYTVLSGWPLVAKPLQGRGVATGGASGGVVDSIAQPRSSRSGPGALQTPSKCPEALSKPSLLGRKASNSSIGQVRMVRDSSAETSSAAVRSFGKSCSFIAVAEVRFASQEALSAATTFPHGSSPVPRPRPTPLPVPGSPAPSPVDETPCCTRARTSAGSVTVCARLCTQRAGSEAVLHLASSNPASSTRPRDVQ